MIRGIQLGKARACCYRDSEQSQARSCAKGAPGIEEASRRSIGAREENSGCVGADPERCEDARWTVRWSGVSSLRFCVPLHDTSTRYGVQRVLVSVLCRI